MVGNQKLLHARDPKTDTVYEAWHNIDTDVLTICTEYGIVVARYNSIEVAQQYYTIY